VKILFINTLYEPHVVGGAETILRAHVNALHCRGFNVAVLTLGPMPGLVSEKLDGVRIWRAGLRNFYWSFGADSPPAWKRIFWHLADIYNPLMVKAVRHVVSVEQPDIVCVHNLTGWSVAAWSELRRSGIPVVQVLHDQYLLCIRSNMFNGDRPCTRQCWQCRLMRFIHPRLSGQVAAVVGVSNFILDKMLCNGYFGDVPIREVIRNARDLPGDTGIRNGPKRADNRVTFGFIGSLMPSKGIELLLEAFVRNAPEEWFLIVAGSGKRDYEDYLKGRYAHQRIRFSGRVPPGEFFNQVDITVVPSLWEDTFPGVVFESFFFGVPVIGSRRGGIPEMIREGVNGVLFNPEDPSALPATMSAVASEIIRWQNAAPIIRETAGEFFDLDGWTERWISLYLRVLNGHIDA